MKTINGGNVMPFDGNDEPITKPKTQGGGL
ncbi:hypothetical protein CHRY9393_03520 [Chryseobacterium fistulae]|uniref:Uncharacterized protein n=1 Tax=Chryseobacterium fistulae TaxID=2675058 RepID=A0A6N4XWP5_9FLAO|nr:hypothetical protein CHRY9393_03520 [Chryseobacterium fistulae]